MTINIQQEQTLRPLIPENLKVELANLPPELPAFFLGGAAVLSLTLSPAEQEDHLTLLLEAVHLGYSKVYLRRDADGNIRQWVDIAL